MTENLTAGTAGGMQMSATGSAVTGVPTHPKDTISGGPIGPVRAELDALVAALREAFPHFEGDAPITPEAIKALGREHVDMIMGWQPAQDRIEFLDHHGNTHAIVFDSGDYEVGLPSGWVLEESSTLVEATHADAARTALEGLRAAATASLKNTSCLMSNPPQNAAIWDLRNQIDAAIANLASSISSRYEGSAQNRAPDN